ncbi:carbonic anhydrase Nec1-like [Musa acuminata AAA Group]|uniref:carbonic anhydrase Nec1-like n=1 Tax=Musa acuminata AAA Group TaxID=214697 RepID=UPI0031D01C89
MRNSRIPFQWLSAPLALLVVLQSHVMATEASGVGADWEYSYDPCSELGPQHWGDLHEEWETCKTGEQQSPISIKPSNIIVSTSLGSLRTNYGTRPAFLQNKGHEILVNWTWSPGDLVIGEKTFHLRQCHWHSPSEHELYGKRYPLELHMVHTTPEGEITVIGMLYEFGPFADPLLHQLSEGLIALQSQDNVYVGTIRPPLIGAREPYFRYSGSLTTPPCGEPVIWTVMKEVKSVTESQLASLRIPVHDKDNARPVQPIKGRNVYKYEPPHEDHASS